MIEILRKTFEANPEKSTIVLKDKCSDCGRETTTEITPTSVGFGMQGGVGLKLVISPYSNVGQTCDIWYLSER